MHRGIRFKGSKTRRQAKAWNRKMSRNHVTINWQFTRKKARRKFGYDRNNITRSETSDRT